MTAKSDDFENGILLLLFNNSVDASTVGSIGTGGLLASTAPGTLAVSLHTTPGPAETGTMTTNVLTYTGYTSQTVARSGAGWTVTTDTSSNAAAITFGQNTDTGAGPSASHVAVGVGTGAVAVLYQGALDSPLTVNENVNPQFAIGALDITEA